MKPITLHPVSVLVGAALVGLSLVLSGAQTPKIAHAPKPEVFGVIPAEWWTYVELFTSTENGTVTRQDFYTVPTDRYFVVTASSIQGIVTVNGADIGLREALLPISNAEATRYVLAPGTVLTITPCVPQPPNNCALASHLWGYLEPVQ